MKNDRKRVLFVTGAVAPLHSTNASLMLRLLDRLKTEADCHLLSIGPYPALPPDELIDGTHCVRFSALHNTVSSSFRGEDAVDLRLGGLLLPRAKAAARLLDRGGYGDLAPSIPLQRIIEQLWKRFRYDMVFASNEPYAAAYALARCAIPGKKALYLIDPFAEMVPLLRDRVPAFRHRTHRQILDAADLIVTTPRVEQAMEESGYQANLSKTSAFEFPLFSELRRTESADSIPFPPEKINLLYCGWLRGEEQLCRVVERLDERFCVTFLGNDSSRLRTLATEAELRTFPAVSRDLAVNAILDADVLLSTGNPYPVHLPSKTFDYLASGKPVVHFYQIPGCPALEYYRAYPLALTLPQGGDPAAAAGQVRTFCTAAPARRLSFREVSALFPALDADQTISKICAQLLRL